MSEQPQSAAPAGRARKPSRRRLRVYRALAATLVPSLFIVGLEGTLRIAGAGYPTDFFLESDDGIVTENERFSWRFFPREIARDSLDLRFENPKPDDTIRIFILGESAAQGDPMPNFGFGRCLEVMLEDRFPDKRIEVINTGVTAISSHVIREIAKDCREYEPDLVVAYIGNNEVVGPYGPGTMLTPLLESGPAIRLHVAFKATKIAQAAESIARSVGAAKGPDRWMGMEHFIGNTIRADDPRMERTYELYEDNLRGILGEFTERDVPVVLCTVATNLRDCPPFASSHRKSITVAERRAWEELYERGMSLDGAGNADEALAVYEEAAAIDDEHAELRWRMGRCEENLGRFEQARAHYIAARDLDTLRFRADSRINAIVREVDGEEDALALVDIESTFVETSANGLPGEDLLYEHVHMNFPGQYRIARAIAPEAARLLGGAENGAWLSENDCARELGLTVYEERRVADKVLKRIARAPFTEQAGHADTVLRLGRAIAEMRPRVTTAELADVVRRRPDDMNLLLSYAIGIAEEGDCDKAVGHFRTVLESKPGSAATHDNLGRCLFESGDFAGAESAFHKALELDESLDNTGLNLSLAIAAQNRLREAVDLFETWAPHGGDVAPAGLQLAALCKGEGELDSARDILTTTIKVRPGRDVLMALAAVELQRQDFDSAGKWYAEVLRRLPEDAEALAGMGRVAEAGGDFESAATLYGHALAIRPDLIQARVGLAKATEAMNGTSQPR